MLTVCCICPCAVIGVGVCGLLDVLCWVIGECRVRKQPETEEEAAAIKEEEKKRVEEQLKTVKDRSKVCYAVGSPF